MKKRKVLSLLALFGMTATLAMGLAACGEKHEHTYGDWTVTTQPTLETGGKATRACKENDDTEELDLPALSDTTFWTVGTPTAPTHTEAGKTPYTNATYNLTVALETAEKIPHDDSQWGPYAWKNDLKPTFTTGATYSRTCTVGGEEDPIEIPAFSDTEFWTESNVTATHTEAGTATFRNDTYDLTFEAAARPALGHDWDVCTWKGAEPTETSGATAEHYCLDDDGGYEEVHVPALSDTSFWTLTTLAPTHETMGYNLYTNAEHKIDYAVPLNTASEHRWGEWKIAAEPTYLTVGGARRDCTVGGTLNADEPEYMTVSLPALLSDAWKLEDSKAPTKTEAGYEVYKHTEYGFTVTVNLNPVSDVAGDYDFYLFTNTSGSGESGLSNKNAYNTIALDARGFVAPTNNASHGPFRDGAWIDYDAATGELCFKGVGSGYSNVQAYLDPASGLIFFYGPSNSVYFLAPAGLKDFAASNWGNNGYMALTYLDANDTAHNILFDFGTGVVHFGVTFTGRTDAEVLTAVVCYNAPWLTVKDAQGTVLYQGSYDGSTLRTEGADDYANLTFTYSGEDTDLGTLILNGFNIALLDGTVYRYTLTSDQDWTLELKHRTNNQLDAYYRITLDTAHSTYTYVDCAVTLTLNGNEHGTFGSSDKFEYTGFLNETITGLTTPTAEAGWSFQGWYADADCSGDPVVTNNSYTPTELGNTDLYAKWVKIFTINYDLNGKSSEKLASQTVLLGGTIELRTPTSTWTATFVQWTYDQEGEQPVESPEAFSPSEDKWSSITLYAQWKDVKLYEHDYFYVALTGTNANGGNSTYGGQNITINQDGYFTTAYGDFTTSSRITGFNESDPTAEFSITNVKGGTARAYLNETTSVIVVILDETTAYILLPKLKMYGSSFSSSISSLSSSTNFYQSYLNGGLEKFITYKDEKGSTHNLFIDGGTLHWSVSFDATWRDGALSDLAGQGGEDPYRTTANFYRAANTLKVYESGDLLAEYGYNGTALVPYDGWQGTYEFGGNEGDALGILVVDGLGGVLSKARLDTPNADGTPGTYTLAEDGKEYTIFLTLDGAKYEVTLNKDAWTYTFEVYVEPPLTIDVLPSGATTNWSLTTSGDPGYSVYLGSANTFYTLKVTLRADVGVFSFDYELAKPSLTIGVAGLYVTTVEPKEQGDLTGDKSLLAVETYGKTGTFKYLVTERTELYIVGYRTGSMGTDVYARNLAVGVYEQDDYAGNYRYDAAGWGNGFGLLTLDGLGGATLIDSDLTGTYELAAADAGYQILLTVNEVEYKLTLNTAAKTYNVVRDGLEGDYTYGGDDENGLGTITLDGLGNATVDQATGTYELAEEDEDYDILLTLGGEQYKVVLGDNTYTLILTPAGDYTAKDVSTGNYHWTETDGNWSVKNEKTAEAVLKFTFNAAGTFSFDWSLVYSAAMNSVGSFTLSYKLEGTDDDYNALGGKGLTTSGSFSPLSVSAGDVLYVKLSTSSSTGDATATLTSLNFEPAPYALQDDSTGTFHWAETAGSWSVKNEKTADAFLKVTFNAAGTFSFDWALTYSASMNSVGSFTLSYSTEGKDGAYNTLGGKGLSTSGKLNSLAVNAGDVLYVKLSTSSSTGDATATLTNLNLKPAPCVLDDASTNEFHWAETDGNWAATITGANSDALLKVTFNAEGTFSFAWAVTGSASVLNVAGNYTLSYKLNDGGEESFGYYPTKSGSIGPLTVSAGDVLYIKFAAKISAASSNATANLSNITFEKAAPPYANSYRVALISTSSPFDGKDWTITIDEEGNVTGFPEYNSIGVIGNWGNPMTITNYDDATGAFVYDASYNSEYSGFVDFKTGIMVVSNSYSLNTWDAENGFIVFIPVGLHADVISEGDLTLSTDSDVTITFTDDAGTQHTLTYRDGVFTFA